MERTFLKERRTVMLKRWMNTIKRRWRAIGGALAVLLMFFVPVTRAVLADNKSPDNKGQQAKAGDKGGAKANTQPGTKASTKSPTTPRNPSPMATTTTGKSAGGGGGSKGGESKPAGK
jgi:cytoskeletal protein RodZ